MAALRPARQTECTRRAFTHLKEIALKRISLHYLFAVLALTLYGGQV